MRTDVRFLLGDEPRSLGSADPTMTVLDYLRDAEGLVGTKEGCNEGDCGACTVVLARPHRGGLRYQAVNACIQFVSTLDGCQLLTVEHLSREGALHPVQQALVDHHGSQCGFCTPGFVMSLFAMTQESKAPPDEAEIDRVLAGNLCRCTGYAPIIRAAKALYEAGHPPDRFRETADKTRDALGRLADSQTIRLADGRGRQALSPASLDGLVALMAEHPGATVSAGATDVGLWITKDMRRPETVIHLGRVAELQRLEEGDEEIAIGAGVSYSDARDALARHFPDMGPVIDRLGSVQIRNAGTIGGNVANGSPIGDMPPMLIAVGARVHLIGAAGRRSLPIEDFFIAYGKQDRRPEEIVEKITVPLPAHGQRFRAYKISKRFDQDISAVLAAFSLRLEAGKVGDARIAFGGMAATPKRAPNAERALAGQPWAEGTVRKAMDALRNDFEPLTDWRASKEYRMAAARNLLLRAYIELAEPAVETRLVGAS